MFVGEWPKGLKGGGFVYTNRDSLSVGFVGQLPSLEQQGMNITDALDAFKRQPAVRRLIAGGERLEYGAHIVPEGGFHMRPRLTRDGALLVGDAAALVVAAGSLYEGVHYAMHSSILAADAVHAALERGDVTASGLADYPRTLNASYVTRNLKAFQHVPELVVNPRMYHHLPQAICNVAEDFFRADARGHRKLGPLLYQHIAKGNLVAALRDFWLTARAFLT
jgi:electron transfer flavoprotein-quinone oxidoreductase